jgi:Lon protease-like protein
MSTDTPAANGADSARTFIFPLNTVLFPGGTLPLKIFEQRYIEMTKLCISGERPFGVCLIKEGRETGTPAVPQDIGCLARIAHWDMPQLGVFHLQVEGLQRFRILTTEVEKNGLISATIECLAQESEVAPEETMCSDVLKAIMDKIGAEHFPSPHRFDDAAWIGYRLSEVLPISLETKQELLRMTDPQARLSQLGKILSSQGMRSSRA